MYTIGAIAIFIFVHKGTDDIQTLSSYFEKVAAINFSVLIGYAALVAAFAGLSSHNTSQDPTLKREVDSFIHIVVIYVSLNMIMLVMSFILNLNGSPDSAISNRFLLAVLISSIFFLSHYVLRLVRRLIF